jgi:hypothetical protein
MTARWARNSAFATHLPLLERAVERFGAGDFVSATAILYPRIEGLLRTMHDTFGAGAKPTQKTLAEAAVKPGGLWLHEHSWLLPGRFRHYLHDVYFATFSADSAPISRNSVGHGVAPALYFNAKAAAIGLLVVDQLGLMLPPAKGAGAEGADGK